MSTILWVFGLVLLGAFTILVFGMTLGKRDMEDFEYLSAYVDKCEKGSWEKNSILEEYHRLLNNGRIPIEKMEELRGRIIKKFK
jgi:hypothetical protein